MAHAAQALLRSRAARAVNAVISHNRTIDWVLENRPEWLSVSEGQHLVYSTLRYYYSLAPIVDEHLAKPLRKKDQDVYSLMLVGTYQLLYTATPSYAVINETVKAVSAIHKNWAAKLINGVLRNIDRKYNSDPESLKGNTSLQAEAELEAKVDPDAETRPTNQSFGPENDINNKNPAQPKLDRLKKPRPKPQLNEWLTAQLTQQYGQRADSLIEACLTQAPMWLRVNRLKISPEAYSAQLRDAGLEHTRPFVESLPETIRLQKPAPSQQLPGWSEGYVAVQDVGAQMAVLCHASRATELTKDEQRLASEHSMEVDPQHPGESAKSLLDACAAPGGKLFHLIEHLHARAMFQNPLPSICALDQSESRISQSKTIGARLGHLNTDHLDTDQLDADQKEAPRDSQHEVPTINWSCGDATDSDWWQGQQFNTILLDAPCSGTGTLRRHPDLQILLQPSDLARHQQTQLALITSLWPMLAPGGTLLYSTCSLLAQENQAVIAEFKSHEPQAEIRQIELPIGQAVEPYGWQITPLDDSDGFYYCLIYKPLE